MASRLTNYVDLFAVGNSESSRVDVRPEFGNVGEAASCVLQGITPAHGLSIQAGANRPATDAAMKGYWFHAPKFGTTDHSQRWRFET